MKRFVPLLTIVILVLAAVLPSAFCMAEESVAARFAALLDALEGMENYANGQALGYIEEAEALLDEPEVQQAYDQDDLDKVAVYRLYYERDCSLAELADRVRIGQRVRFGAGEERTYASREWDEIETSYQAAVERICSATSASAMQEAVSSVLAEAMLLPTYSEIYDQWCERYDRVVNREIGAIATRVNAYRRELGVDETEAPTFLVRSAESSSAMFEAYLAANVEDAASIAEAFGNALEATSLLGLYAIEDEMRSVWADYRAATATAALLTPQREVDLSAAIDAAVDTLRRAVANSDYVASASAEDQAFYYALPEVMRREMQNAEDEAEVEEMLALYLARIEADSMVQPKQKLGTLGILMIVTAAISVLLFAAYFVMKRRQPPRKKDKNATELLAELQAMAAAKQGQPSEERVQEESAEEDARQLTPSDDSASHAEEHAEEADSESDRREDV